MPESSIKFIEIVVATRRAAMAQDHSMFWDYYGKTMERVTRRMGCDQTTKNVRKAMEIVRAACAKESNYYCRYCSGLLQSETADCHRCGAPSEKGAGQHE